MFKKAKKYKAIVLLLLLGVMLPSYIGIGSFCLWNSNKPLYFCSQSHCNFFYNASYFMELIEGSVIFVFVGKFLNKPLLRNSKDVLYKIFYKDFKGKKKYNPSIMKIYVSSVNLLIKVAHRQLYPSSSSLDEKIPH